MTDFEVGFDSELLFGTDKIGKIDQVGKNIYSNVGGCHSHE